MPTNGHKEEAGFPTPFEKGKPVERPGRKATGLRADLPRQLLLAGLPKRSELDQEVLCSFKGGSPYTGPPLRSGGPVRRIASRAFSFYVTPICDMQDLRQWHFRIFSSPKSFTAFRAKPRSPECRSPLSGSPAAISAALTATRPTPLRAAGK